MLRDWCKGNSRWESRKDKEEMRGTYGDDVWLNAWIEQESFQLHTQRIEVETCSNRQRSVLTSTTHIPTTCYISTSSRLYLLLSTTDQLHLIHRVGGINKTSTHQRPVTHRCSTVKGFIYGLPTWQYNSLLKQFSQHTEFASAHSPPMSSEESWCRNGTQTTVRWRCVLTDSPGTTTIGTRKIVWFSSDLSLRGAGDSRSSSRLAEHTHTHRHSLARSHARTHARTHPHTHTHKPNSHPRRLGVTQEAPLSPRDRAMRRVNWNLANCHATVQKLLIRQVLTKSMVWNWRFSRRQCVIDNVHSTMTRSSRLPLSQVS